MSQAVPAGVGEVHLVEIAGEQVGLLTAFGTADLDDHVAPGVGIGRHHQLGELRSDRRQGLVGGRQLGFEQVALVAVRLSEQLPGGFGVGEEHPFSARCGDDRGQFVIAAADGAQLGWIGRHRWVGEARLEVGVLLLDGSEAAGDGICHRRCDPIAASRRVRHGGRG